MIALVAKPGAVVVASGGTVGAGDRGRQTPEAGININRIELVVVGGGKGDRKEMGCETRRDTWVDRNSRV